MHHLVRGHLRVALAGLFLGLVSLFWLSAIGQAAPDRIVGVAKALLTTSVV